MIEETRPEPLIRLRSSPQARWTGNRVSTSRRSNFFRIPNLISLVERIRKKEADYKRHIEPKPGPMASEKGMPEHPL